MSIITLTSDWEKNDFYLASVKGKIYSEFRDATIVDISHNIPTHNLAHAAFVVRNSYHCFPKGSVHIIGVRSEKSLKNRYLAIQYDGHYFLSTDNGVFGLIMQKQVDRVIEIFSESETSIFPELQVFAQTAAHLVQGKPLEVFGNPTTEFRRSTPIIPAFDESYINGSVIYVDSYRNAITNIQKSLFERIGRNRRFDIYLQSFNNKNKISKISNNYSEVPTTELVAVFNSVDLLEIAMNEGEVVDLFNLDNNSSIIIKFYD